ncbi:hypothetical protein [Prosthecochloris sp. SCSIO W1101]|uniref:hypothetical protein n=1 Tax=Prosthecochloris sp. SCSIO W1101 TaxID=2992242 RepID=UPI002AC85ED2|nr:hypothetical protein [Prosthecochloris sp. SCSIO W1101]
MPGQLVSTGIYLPAPKDGLPQLIEQSSNDREAELQWRKVMSISTEAVRLFIGSIPDKKRKQYDLCTILEANFPIRVSAAEHYLMHETPVKAEQLSRLWTFLQRILVAMVSNREIEECSMLLPADTSNHRQVVIS